MIKRCFIGIVFLFSLVWVSSTVNAAEYYVSPSGQDSQPGTLSQPFRSIKNNMWRLQAGDSMILRGGVYDGDKIELLGGRNGTAAQPITIKAYPGEKPILRNSYVSPNGGQAILAIGNSYYIFDGINIDTVYGQFAYIERTSYITIKNCEFKNANGVWMGVYVLHSNNLKIQNCVMDKVSDNTNNQNKDVILLENTHFSLLENLTLTRGTHSLIGLQNSRNNVIRNNVLRNEWQKNVGIGAPATGNLMGRNVFENNIVFGSRPAIVAGYTGKGAMGLYLNQKANIVRRNVIYDNYNFGILVDGNNGLGNSNVNFNKIYNNTIHKNGYYKGYAESAGLTITDFSTNLDMSNNTVKNNIFSENDYFSIYVKSRNGIGFDNNTFRGNCFYRPVNPNTTMKVEGVNGGIPNALSWFQTNWNNYVVNNFDTNPLFLNTTISSPNFSLANGSPCIDKGVPLTTPTNLGSGTQIPVEDAGYFFDGFGIVSGDMIQVGTEEVLITQVDYTNNILTVNRTISWTGSTPISLPFAGNAPDPGAHENGFVSSLPTPTSSVVSTPRPIPTPPSTPMPLDNGAAIKFSVSSVVASSSQDPNVPNNTLDGNINTRWSACGVGQWISYDLGAVKTVSHVNMAFYLATTQIAKLDIEVSTDGTTWRKVFSGQSGTSSFGLQKFDFPDTEARYVRVMGNGNLTSDATCWNSYTEVEIYGFEIVSPTQPMTKIGDANGDGKVDGLDYVVWALNFGKELQGNTSGDFNNDGQVDGIDYVLWLTNYEI